MGAFIPVATSADLLCTLRQGQGRSGVDSPSSYEASKQSTSPPELVKDSAHKLQRTYKMIHFHMHPTFIRRFWNGSSSFKAASQIKGISR